MIKYVIYNHVNTETPMIIPFDIQHNHVMVHSDLNGRTWPVSAGFCHIIDGKFTCYGESESLKLKSRGEIDAAILNDYFGALT